MVKEKTSLHLFENRKECPNFWKKARDCAHLCVKFSSENVVLRVSRRKNSTMFPCVASFFVFLTKCSLKCHSSTNITLSCREKFPVTYLYSGTIHFANCYILNLLQCSENFCLHNCSVICKVTCIGHIQTSGIFRTLFFKVYFCIFSHIQRY